MVTHEVRLSEYHESMKLHENVTKCHCFYSNGNKNLKSPYLV